MRSVLAVAVVAVVLAGCSGGDEQVVSSRDTSTTTTAPSTTASTTSPPTTAGQTTTTARGTTMRTTTTTRAGATSSTTTTTLPPLQRTDPRSPPRAALDSGAGRAESNEASYCWGGPGEAPLCTTVIVDESRPALGVRRGETLVLQFSVDEAPSGIKVARTREGRNQPPEQQFDVAAGNPARFQADFPAGTQWLDVTTQWPRGSVTYFFKIAVS